MATQVEIGKACRMSLTRLHELQGKGIIPKGCTPDEALDAYIPHMQALAGNRLSENGLDLAGERARLAAEQADAQAMKNALQRGEQAPIADLEFAVTSLLSGIRGRLLSLPSKLALELAAEGDPAVCQELVAKGLNEALTDIAAVRIADLAARRAAPWGAEDHRERGEGDEPAERAVGRRMGRRKANGRGRDEPGAGPVEE